MSRYTCQAGAIALHTAIVMWNVCILFARSMVLARLEVERCDDDFVEEVTERLASRHCPQQHLLFAPYLYADFPEAELQDRIRGMAPANAAEALGVRIDLQSSSFEELRGQVGRLPEATVCSMLHVCSTCCELSFGSSRLD
jgi:hypothetical protein